jgi:hypothetical protein
MSQPVKLSDALVLDARMASEVLERSIAGQIEFWARLGRALEPMLDGTQVMALCRNATAQPLSDCLDTVDSPQGRSRVTTFLRSQPYPHYEPAPDAPGLLIRTDADGRKTRGRFVNRKFKAVRSGTR